MSTTPRDTNTDQPTSHSSMSLSQEKVCEGEACIRKAVNPPTAEPADAAQTDAKRKKAPSTSMSVGGEEACQDDACIGKK